MSKFANFEHVETVMDRMMQAPVLTLMKKLEINGEEKLTNLIDPNLIMDARHRFLQKPVSPTNSNKNQLKSSSSRINLTAIRKAREDHLFQLELRRFEKCLQNARPKFHQYKTCRKNMIAYSDNDEFWSAVISHKSYKSNEENSTHVLSEINNHNNIVSKNNISIPNISVTIKDKPTLKELAEENQNILRKVLRTLKEYAKRKKHFRELKLKVQQHFANKLLRRCLQIWKNYVGKSKTLALKKKEKSEMTHERRIEMFINAIAKRQEELIKLQKFNKNDTRSKSAPEVPTRPAIFVRQACVVESPAQNRLKVQQKIIEDQRIKLARQRKIIEEMQLKEFQTETKKISNKTIEAAKEILDYCGPTTRRTLLQLIREKGFSAKTEDKPLRVPSPPEFLTRMEARAEARKERVKKAKEARERKLEEEKQRVEQAKIEEEERRRELQLEAQREAKRLRKERERQQVLQLERQRMLIEKTNQFYEHYLLKRFIIFPFKALIKIKRSNEAQAKEHYDKTLLKKCVTFWKLLTKTELDTKIKTVDSIYEKNLLIDTFYHWKNFVLESKGNYQVALDFYDMKLQIRTFSCWKFFVSQEKVLTLTKERIAVQHYEKQLLIASFAKWMQYLEIAEEVRESEKRKEELRAVVQTVIPDFDPKYRGVALDD